MKIQYKFHLSLFFFLVGCGGTQFNQIPTKPSQTPEEIIEKALEVYAQESGQCSSQKLALVKNNQTQVRNLITQIKKLAAPNAAPGINMKAMQNYAGSSESDHFQLLVQILTSDTFKTVLLQSSSLLKQVAYDSIFMSNLSGIQGDLNLEPGDRIAEILTILSTSSEKREILLRAAQTILCTDTASEQTILDALQSPAVLWELGPNGVYLLGSPFFQHAEPLIKSIKALQLPQELDQFVVLIKSMIPSTNICPLENLSAYEKHFELLASLVDSESPRPIKNLSNLLLKVYTMQESNQCTGISLDDLKQENIQNAFLTVAQFLADEKEGLPAFLQAVKPRT